MRIIVLLIFVILFASVLYYSWLPEPSFDNEIYMPLWLVKFTNEYGILRTGIPFILLGVNIVILRVKNLNYFKNFIILLTLLLIAELGQLFLPHRHFDIADILIGTIAIVIGLFIGELLMYIFKKNFISTKKI